MYKEECNGRDFDFLIGKSIIKVEEQKNEHSTDIYQLICNDGTIIEIETNEGCGGCNNGWSTFDDLKKLENNHNIITNVKCEYNKKWCEDYSFKLFIYYQDDMLTLEGDDGYGNGYYGGGFYVTIENVNEFEKNLN